jgi:hypothetical protein
MLQQCQKVLAKAPSTRDPKRTWAFALHISPIEFIQVNLDSALVNYVGEFNTSLTLLLICVKVTRLLIQ